jgi:hypothetical protein
VHERARLTEISRACLGRLSLGLVALLQLTVSADVGRARRPCGTARQLPLHRRLYGRETVLIGRLSTSHLATAGVALAALFLVVLPADASAAKPVKRARYIDTNYAYTVDLRVSKSGRSVTVKTDFVYDCDQRQLSAESGRRPVPVDRSGRFRYVRRSGRLSIAVSGRFQTRNRAIVTLRWRRQPRRRFHPCDGPFRDSVSPKRIRRIPFRDCRTHRAETVLSAPTGRVFWQPLWDDRDGWMTVAYACLFSVDRRFALGQDDDDDHDIGAMRLVGSYLAYAEIGCVGVGCGYGVVVRDLRDGGVARSAPTPYVSQEFFGPVADLELKENASVAWIAGPAPYSNEVGPSVWAYDGAGKRRLDTGDISPTSLELDGSTLTWVKEGVLRSATLD